MGTKRLALQGRRSWAVVCLVGWLCVAVTTACAGEGDPMAKVSMSDSADVGKSLRAQGWVVTLIEQPQQRKQVGSVEGAFPGGSESDHFVAAGFSSMPEAEGMWLILGIELTNESGDLAMLSIKLLTVVDDQGREASLEGITVHSPHIWSEERWMKEENQLIQVVMYDEEVRQGPLIYDVPEDATGLKLVMQGTDETIDLGF